MVNSLKKVFSTFVTLTTVAWSVGVGTLALPSVASAAVLNSGDLIKASGPAVYFYAQDGKRYVFPNEKTYFSWFNDFASVKTISDGELAAIPIGSNVTIRPGTKLVKITTDPKTYAVTKCGVLHWIESEAIAKALYGDAWNTRIVDVPDGFFVNYTIGSSVANNVHPDGQVVSYAGDSNWYVVWGGMKRKFASDAAAAANMINPANAVQTSIAYGNGSDVTGREADLADVVCAGSPVVGGDLQVSLASDTPAGMNVPRNSSSVALVKVNLTAGSGAVNITGLKFHRVGVGAAADLTNVYLYDQDGKRLTTGRTVNSQTNMAEFNSLNISIPAGQTKSFFLYGDFDVDAGSTGGQHAFELMDAASAVVTGNSTISGSFPVRGNVFTVGTTEAGTLTLQKGATPANPTIGAQDVEISNFKLQGSSHDIEVKQVTLYQAGSITNSDLTDLKLWQGTTLVAQSASVAADGHIVLKFAAPYLIANGTTKVFSLTADVAGRSGRTIRTYVEYTTDITATDKMYNAGASIDLNNFDGTSSNYIEVTTQGGQLTNAFNGPATSNIAKGQLAVPLYKFTLTSSDNTLEIRNMRFTLSTSGGTCNLYDSAGTQNFLRSLKIKNLDTGVTVMGPTDYTTGSATSRTLTFTDSFNINAGQTMNLALVTDLANSDSGDYIGCPYVATFNAFQSNDIRVSDTGEFLDLSKVVPNTTVAGNALTVKASRLDIALASNPVSGTIVKKQQNVEVAGLTLTSSAESDVTITNLTLSAQAKLALSGCTFGDAGTCNETAVAQRITSLALYDGATQVGLAKAPDTTTGKAQITNMNLLIAKGTTKSLTVKASFASTASSSSPYDQVAVGLASNSDVQAQDQDSNTVTPSLSAGVTGQLGASPSVVQTIRPSGTLTVQADSHPVSNIVVAGKDAWVPMAQYKATAQFEDINLDRIAVLASSTIGTFSDNADIAWVALASNGAIKGQDILPSGATGTKDVDLSANMIVVPKGGSATFQIWAKLAAVQASSSVNGANSGVARSGHVPAMGLQSGLVTGEWDSNYAGNLNIRAIGAASGERVYASTGASHGNGMVLRKSVPIITKQALSSTTLVNADMDLMKFQVAADAAGSIKLKQVIFNYSLGGTGVNLANFRLRRGATDLDLSLYNVVSETGADLKTGSVASSSGYIIVSMAAGQEEAISGSGNVYTIHATVTGADNGDSVTLSFYRDPSAPIVTGYLVNSVAGAPFLSSASIYHIDTATNPSATFGARGSFLWSDDSETPHSSAVQTSRDWTNDVYVQDLSQSQTLSQ